MGDDVGVGARPHDVAGPCVLWEWRRSTEILLYILHIIIFSAIIDYIELFLILMTFEMTFEKHLRLISRADSQRLGILRKSWRVFHDRAPLGRCFRGFVLPVLEYCSAVWCSAADTHLKLLDRAVQWCLVSNWGCVWVWHFSSSIRGSPVYAL